MRHRTRLQLLAAAAVALFLLGVDGVVLPLPTEIGDSFEFDLQITVPYSITLPYYVGRRRRRRNAAAEQEEALMAALLGQSRQGLVLGLMDSIFDWLRLDDDPCQRRFLCLLTQDPDKYFPLSGLILNHLDSFDTSEDALEEEAHLAMMPNASWIRYLHLWDAGRRGTSLLTDCVRDTPTCAEDPDDRIDWTALRFVRALARHLDMRFN